MIRDRSNPSRGNLLTNTNWSCCNEAKRLGGHDNAAHLARAQPSLGAACALPNRLVFATTHRATKPRGPTDTATHRCQPMPNKASEREPHPSLVNFKAW